MHWNDHEFGSVYGVIPKLTSETGFKKCAKTVALSREWWVSWQFFLCVCVGGFVLIQMRWPRIQFHIRGNPKTDFENRAKTVAVGRCWGVTCDFIVQKIQHFTNYLRTILQHWYYPLYRLPTAYITHYRTVYTLLTCRWRRTINWTRNLPVVQSKLYCKKGNN